MTDPVVLLLVLVGLIIIVLAVAGRIGEATNIVIAIVLLAALVVALRVLGVL